MAIIHVSGLAVLFAILPHNKDPYFERVERVCCLLYPLCKIQQIRFANLITPKQMLVNMSADVAILYYGLV